jgi:alpha-2-macroglobulin-like protein
MKSNRPFRWLSALFSLLLMGLLASFQLPFDDGFLSQLRQQLDGYNRTFPQEKIYLQIDKPFYKPGEDIWLSAFVVSGPEQQPTTVSQVIYVELINPKGGIEKNLSLPLVKGRTLGDFALEEAAPGGLYKIRAYSQWMKNAGEASFFEKTIQVQKVLTPRLLLKLDFDRKAYGPSETVVADFEARDLRNDPLVGQPFVFTVQLNGETQQQTSASTDQQGKCRIQFNLPERLSSADGLLNVVLELDGQKESISRSIPIVLNQIDLQFFPEGGEWVENVAGKLAFKALNEFGKPADVEGVIIDAQGNTVQSFRSFHQGMGAFELKASRKQSYRARLTQPQGISRLYDLPLALPKGYTLAAETVSEQNLSVSFHAPVAKEVHLVAQVRGQIYFAQKIIAQTGLNRADIPLKDFPMGVAQITLFDHNQLARCERLVFVNAHKKLTIHITSHKKEYRPREKVELTIHTLDEDSLPVPASLALSVVDDQLISFADDKQDHILSYLLMSSDLKGKVEEPAFYFKKDEPKAAQALDYVLMTQGWRRFAWKEVLEAPPAMSYYPEKFGTVSGRVLSGPSGIPQSATVTLFELGNEQRSAQLKTNPDGTFTFLDVDPSAPIQLVAQTLRQQKESLRIQLDQQATASNASVPTNQSSKTQSDVIQLNEVIQGKLISSAKNAAEPVQSDDLLSLGNNNLSLSADVKSLSEVVVVGYGTQRRSDLTGSIVSVSPRDFNVALPRWSAEQVLQGRAAGVFIQPPTNPSSSGSNVRIRGSNSVSINSPLYVIDGFPLNSHLNNHFSALDFLSPDQIDNITVLKSPEAIAIWGSEAANGVIVINTKKHNDYRSNYGSNNPSSRSLSSTFIAPRTFSQVREFYAPQYQEPTTSSDREDFRSTLYWKPDVQTDQHGTAKLSFYNSDQITSFRVTVEGMGSKLVGREEYTYFTQQPVQLDAKIPPYLTFEDIVHLPVLIRNNTSSTLQGVLRIAQADGMALQPYDSLITLPPREARTYRVSARVLSAPGKGKLKIVFQSADFSDVLTQETEIQPKGFPTITSVSDKALDKSFRFSIKEPIPGSLKAELKAYPDIIGDLMAGIESILQEPHGCFEQTSASTYPNILALEYLRETGKSQPELEARALQYIKAGYKRLAGFETKQDGFEWYGQTPPHEGLTAFGLMEFLEMKKVYPDVSGALIDRTQKWLLSRREGNGNFRQNRGKYGFSAASRTVNNAYVVYALSEAGVKDIGKEYEYAYQEALESKDAYRMALLALASFNRKEKAKGEILLNHLQKQANELGLGGLKADHSIVISYGKSLQVETASLLALAILKSETPSVSQLTTITAFLAGSRSGGGFGSTQATILALQALTQYAQFMKRTQESGRLVVYLNGQRIDSRFYEKGTRGEILVTGLEKQMQPGEQQFRVAFEDTQEALPYSLDVTWNAYTPPTNAECKVDLETRLLSQRVAAGQTVRLTTRLRNKTAEGVPMTVALVGIPSGLSPQPWQLKEMQEKGLVDFYEVRKNYVVFYYRELGPQALHQLQLDLKAEVPGVYQAPASSAYLYYTPEFKDWEGGEKVEVGF